MLKGVENEQVAGAIVAGKMGDIHQEMGDFCHYPTGAD